jgi:hypothetical protein
MIPFEVPDRFVTGVTSGMLRRIGTTLRDRINGRIVAHLQETRLLQQMLGGAVGTGGKPLGLLLSVAQFSSSIWANVQLEQIKSMLITLGMLNAASLAASVAGIGVSAVGFAVVLKRLAGLERLVAGVQRDVLANRLVAERVDTRLETAHRAVVDGLLYRAEEAWVRSDAARVWGELDGPLDQAQRYWRELVGTGSGRSILLDDRFTLDEAAAAYETALNLAAARIQVLLLVEEHAAALHCASEFHEWNERAVGGLLAVDLAVARYRRFAALEGISEEDARIRLLRVCRPFTNAVHEMRLHVASRLDLLRAFIDQGIRGREYVEAIRDATIPILVLPVH